MLELFVTLVFFGLAGFGAFSLIRDRGALRAKLQAETRYVHALAEGAEHTAKGFALDVEDKLRLLAGRIGPQFNDVAKGLETGVKKVL